jgi:hypothetical protein
MLYPLTVAIVIVAIAGFTIYVFRLSLARWLGRAHRQIQEDELEIRREYSSGLRKNRD